MSAATTAGLVRPMAEDDIHHHGVVTGAAQAVVYGALGLRGDVGPLYPYIPSPPFA